MAANMIGRVFGFWTVIGPLESRRTKDGKSKSFWLCQCSCKFEKFIYIGALNFGSTSKCRECGYKFAPRKPLGYAARNAILSSYKTQARVRKHLWQLSDEEFDTITKKNCYYCGAKPSNNYVGSCNGGFVYNGIDRVDNSRGYLSENVVTCCKLCNQAKSAMTQQEFIQWARRVADHTKDQ